MNSTTEVSAPARLAGLRVGSPRLGIGLIAAAAFGLELAVSGRYGYVRDELYFLSAGRHLAFGYVDQPALTPLIARMSAALTGNSLVGLRLIPALGLATIVVITAAISRLLGAGRTGQLLAALAGATCGEYLAAMHELTTTMPDFVFWAVLLLLVTRLLVSQDPRWWLAIGGCAGIASEAKWNIGFLAVSLGAGLLTTDARRLLRSRYLLAGCALAAALAAADVAWQAAHGWPNLAVFRVLQSQDWHNRATYWPAQVLFTGLALTPVWLAGLSWSLRRSQRFVARPVAIGCAIAITLQFVLGGKPYYPGGAYTFLLAAGCVPVERWLAARRPIWRIRPAAAAAGVMVASAAAFLPVAVPVLPAVSFGGPWLVARVARDYAPLPWQLRRRTTVLAGNYGEAGALDRYGPAAGLPQAYSGANSFWLWGPPPATDTAAIAINIDPALLRREFARVRLVAIFRNGLGVSDDEQGARIYLATGLRTSWAAAWPAFRDYSLPPPQNGPWWS